MLAEPLPNHWFCTENYRSRVNDNHNISKNTKSIFYIEINPKLVITKRHSDVGDQDDDGWTDEEAIDARVESNGVVRDGERNQGEKDV